MQTRFKTLSMITIFIGALFFNNGCTQDQEALVAGVAVAAALSSHDEPKHYDRPYYYHNNKYYYGGSYKKGYYHHGKHKYSGGHYYHKGYRHHRGNRYKAVNGTYGYYTSREHYNRYKYRR